MRTLEKVHFSQMCTLLQVRLIDTSKKPLCVYNRHPTVYVRIYCTYNCPNLFIVCLHQNIVVANSLRNCGMHVVFVSTSVCLLIPVGQQLLCFLTVQRKTLISVCGIFSWSVTLATRKMMAQSLETQLE